MNSVISFLLIFSLCFTYCLSRDVPTEDYVCFAPASDDYGPECPALIPIEGTKNTDTLQYKITVVKPDKDRVWCEGKSYYTSDKEETSKVGVWYLLGNAFDTYAYNVPWYNVSNALPSIRCKAEGTDDHLIDYTATLFE